MELEYPAEIVQEQLPIFNNDYRSQTMEEKEVEAILLGKEEGLILQEIQAMEIQEKVEEAEEGEIPQIPMQQE